MPVAPPVVSKALVLLGLSVVASGLVGCKSDQGINSQGSDPNAKPDIFVDPVRADFGGVPYDQTEVLSLTIGNRGTAGLDVDEVVVAEGTAFSLASDWTPERVAADDSLTVELVYSPINTEDEGWLVIASDDPDTPELWLALQGEGLFPELEISPASADLGDTIVCYELSETLELRNTGDAPLEITAVDQVGEGFSLTVPDDALPWTLEPDEAVDVEVHFLPETGGEQAGTLYVESNDPAGQKSATQLATAESFASQEVVDTWRQPDGPWDAVDLLFVVDQSASMDDDRQRIVDNLAHLVDTLDSAGLSWQAMVVSDDDGCSNTGVVGSTSSAAVATLQDGVYGPSGWHAESLLSVAVAALEQSEGGCNAGFVRSEAKTLVVAISDEADHSDADPEALVSMMRAHAETVALVAIVGDVPDGCETADPGLGYVSAADYSGGEVLSICDTDWSDHFDVVVDLAAAEPTDTVSLSYDPDPDTIVVEIDGVETAAWTYDDAENVVILDEEPEAGAYVEITYIVKDSCD